MTTCCADTPTPLAIFSDNPFGRSPVIGTLHTIAGRHFIFYLAMLISQPVSPKTRSPLLQGTYILATIAAVLFTWLLHELTHWGVGELLGNEMTMTLNSSSPVNGHYHGRFHYSIVILSAPVFTILEGFFAYRILKKDGDLHWLPVLITCAYMRILAGFMNLVSLNDEGKISVQLGLGKFTLSILVAALFIWWCRNLLLRRRYSTTLLLGTIGMVMLFSSILILADQFFHLRII